MMIFLVSAATQKKSVPRKKICTTTKERNGWKYHQRWPELMRVWSAHGASVPAITPKTMPLKAKVVATMEPAQRPPR